MSLNGLALASSRRDFLLRFGPVAAAGAFPSTLFAQAASEASAVQSLINRIVQQKDAPGAVAAFGIGTEPPRIISGGTLAFDSKQTVDGDTLWRVYSMTKPVTGMAAMLLIAEGKLKLDQPIAELLPEFGSMRVLTDPANSLDSRPAKNPITVRHLLTHTAGFGVMLSKPPLRAAYEKLGLTPGRRSHAEEAKATVPTAPSLEEFAKRLATLPLQSEPGERWSYSVGLDLLGRVIEVASGMPFDAYLHSRFFTPLGMTSTTFQVPGNDRTRLASNYVVESGKKAVLLDPGSSSIFLDKPAFPFGGSGLVSSARDFDRFLAMLAHGGTLDGKVIMPRESVATGMSNLLPAGADMSGYVFGKVNHGFGAGGRVSLGGPDKGTYGWLGAAGTTALVNPARKLRIGGYLNVMLSFGFANALPAAVEKDLA